MTAEAFPFAGHGGHRPPLQKNIRDQLFLSALHLCRGARALVVEPVQMEEAVGNVEPHLVVGCCPETPGLTPRCLGADENLTVLKGDHVRRACFLEKTPMQLRHAAIGHKNNAHFIKRTEHMPLGAAQLQALAQGAFREILQRGQLYRNFPLPIIHGDFWHSLIHEEINRGLHG
jgi:hypothetical protein